MRADSERIGAALVLLLGLGYLWGAISIQDVSIGDPLGPRAFPLIIGGSMSLLACSLILRPGPRLPFRGMTPSTMGLVVLLGLYGYGIPILGYPLATLFFLVISNRLLGQRGIFWGVVISCCVSAGIFLLFTKVLEIPLPLGPLGALRG